MKLTACNGVLDLLNSSKTAKASEEYTFFLSGDLNQMSTQKSFLIRQGFDVGQTNVYPVLKPNDVTKALKLIYENKIEGWWQYSKECISRGICTTVEFTQELKRQYPN